MRWGFLIWELIFYYMEGSNYWRYGYKTQQQKQHKNYQDVDKKSAINKKLILRIIICLQVFLSNINKLHINIWFQAFLSNCNNL